MSQNLLTMSPEEVKAYIDSLREGRASAVQTKILGKIKESQTKMLKESLRKKTDEASDILMGLIKENTSG